jgi:hypothetical protein
MQWNIQNYGSWIEDPRLNIVFTVLKGSEYGCNEGKIKETKPRLTWNQISFDLGWRAMLFGNDEETVQK